MDLRKTVSGGSEETVSGEYEEIVSAGSEETVSDVYEEIFSGGSWKTVLYGSGETTQVTEKETALPPQR